MKVKYIYFFSVVILFLMVMCQEEEKDVLFVKAGYSFPYQMSAPERSWELPGKLVEISGISYIDENRLACVQDERGNIYIFNTASGKIEKKTDFGEDGDYEDIVVVENDAWVLRSDGTLFRCLNYQDEEKLKVTEFKTALHGKNDTEGLALLPHENSLLIACKGKPFIGESKSKKKDKKIKAVYRFDLKTKQLDKSPFLLIHVDSLRKKILKNNAEGKFTFKPSGIAIHPVTGNIYIIASAGKMMAVFSEEGELLAMIRLKKKIFKQPEGISFSPGGTMFISNEGGKDKGTILKFTSDKF